MNPLIKHDLLVSLLILFNNFFMASVAFIFLILYINKKNYEKISIANIEII